MTHRISSFLREQCREWHRFDLVDSICEVFDCQTMSQRINWWINAIKTIALIIIFIGVQQTNCWINFCANGFPFRFFFSFLPSGEKRHRHTANDDIIATHSRLTSNRTSNQRSNAILFLTNESVLLAVNARTMNIKWIMVDSIGVCVCVRAFFSHSQCNCGLH